jgi:hypothetical protein
MSFEENQAPFKWLDAGFHREAWTPTFDELTA